MSEQSNDSAFKALPEIRIQFGDPKESHILKFSLRSLIEIHKLTNKNPITGEIFNNISPFDIAVLVWAGMLHEKEPLTVDQVSEKVLFSDMNELGAKIRAAYTQSSPESKETEEKKTDSPA